ncbi:hypothetical protein Sme01_43800 [Sphaerisporangium melleum]|uniref:Secreted protein n=1 Tax=Sphaerisporangium melleum TaxID=321316 RepID=A0A917QZ65_9ACTN|nr:hypothetical protein [Sphaerisporangium melleum]GGK77876.1 hypothetical protein GCM10007964_20760 [Sphaerisporangium melleum]GII71904.1 hypothetical protein Sme01_43800 [Sphaerisporangium melleum]
MRKIRNLLVGTALAGALAAGVAAAPAASASTASATAATSASQALSRHGFGPFYSDFGRGEDRSDRAYVKGFWGKSGGRYYLDFDLFDQDRDRQYAWLDVYYHDRGGWHLFKRYRTFGHFERKIFFGRGVDGFRFRVGEGSTSDYDWSGWHRYGF